MTVAKESRDDGSLAELLEQVRSMREGLDQFVARHETPTQQAGKQKSEEGTNASWEPSPHLKERWDRHEKLVQEIERQSDAGAINLDELMRRYHQEYDRPALMLAQDLQTQALIYHNVVEELKKAIDVDEAAQTLKNRYVNLGLIDGNANRWPNPRGVGQWLMRHSLDKLSQFRHAMLELLRTRGRQLLRELNFDPSLAVALQLSLGTDTSFGISVQAQVLSTREERGQT
jgi:hypothetical protein